MSLKRSRKTIRDGNRYIILSTIKHWQSQGPVTRNRIKLDGGYDEQQTTSYLKNLIEEDLIEISDNNYQLTAAGRTYLQVLELLEATP